MPANMIHGPLSGAEVERLLRHKTSREYFKHGRWTADVNEADRFQDIIEVAQTCTRYDLKDVELALHSRHGCEVFSTPMR